MLYRKNALFEACFQFFSLFCFCSYKNFISYLLKDNFLFFVELTIYIEVIFALFPCLGEITRLGMSQLETFPGGFLGGGKDYIERLFDGWHIYARIKR